MRSRPIAASTRSSRRRRDERRKELVAEALHASARKKGRFVAVNCGVLSEELLASELFGHVRGTLFLDELGELPRALQPKLLRVLEAGKVRPVGATDEIEVDVAVVAATNRDLIADVNEGRFRADLYARVAQWLIAMPALRDRREDIPLLVRALLGRCGAADRPLTLALAEALLIHPWPLNVRGLFNVLSIAALSCPAGTPLDLSPEVTTALDAARALAPKSVRIAAEAPVAAAEGQRPPPPAEALHEALARANGNISAAARALSCSRQQLYRWLEARGVTLDTFRGKP